MEIIFYWYSTPAWDKWGAGEGDGLIFLVVCFLLVFLCFLI